ncbi:MAG: CHAT domain-containing protein [Phaeodactylibacter sp.]|nr:CHAT domain-containing protein [Phaeodactylibacter sp.]
MAFDEYEKAIQFLQKALRIRETILKPTSFDIGTSYDNIGNSFYYLNEYKKSIYFFQKALEIFKHSASRTAKADQYSKIAACYTNLKNFDAANNYMDSCFAVLEFNRDLDHPFELYEASRTHLLITLYFKAKNHQKAYEAGRGVEQLYEASYWFGLCIELIEYINSTFEESGSKQYLLDRFYYVFEAAINCKYHLYQETDSLKYLEQAFGYAEGSKALLLKEAMQMADASFEFGIPESLLKEERRLRKAIIEKENRRYEFRQNQEEGPQTIHGLNNEIFNLKQEHHRVMDSIRQQYPKAHRLRYAGPPMTPGQIQEELLAPGQALLQYFVGEEYIFLFVIGRENVALIKRPIGEGLSESVRAFRESIYGWSQSQEDSLARQYADYGYQLYQSLVQPVAHLLPEHLIIIPDGILEYLPFEALLLETTQPGTQSYASYPYLIRDHQISYAHSAQLLQEMKAMDYQAPRQWILAFAPSFEDPPGQENTLASRRRSLGRLMNNVKEVQSIKSLLRTRIYKGADATRERFLADAPYYSIIHLATHAKANDEEGEYSYLAFTEVPDTLQNELLYAKDLYSLRLQAEMVVLSACESGVGELRRGEGVISLARGFSYAGAKSLAMTLWRVSDRESAALMQLFYKYLKEGKPKDEALRAAKTQFIAQHNGARAHPFFWAAFILSGDMAPIAVRQPIFPIWGLALLGVLFVFLWSRFAKRKPN